MQLKGTYAFILVILLVAFTHFVLSSKTTNVKENDTSEILLRKRRYLAFPVGATFSMAFCMTVGVIGQPSAGIYTWGLNWGISYNLPNQTESRDNLIKLRKLPVPLVARRYRRDLYTKVEAILNDLGYKGRECIYRALCEASQKLEPSGGTMIEQLFRTAFTLPDSEVPSSEHIDHHLYDTAQRKGIAGLDCRRTYRMCPVSLLDLALGYYNPTFDQNKLYT